MRKNGTSRGLVSVCLPVRLSVTLVYCSQMAKDIVELFLSLIAPITLGFLSPFIVTQFQGQPLLRRGRTLNKRGFRKIRQILVNISLYLGNGTG